MKTEMLLEFQNETHFEIIGLYLMYIGLAIDLLDIDLWGIDLLDIDKPSKHFFISKTSCKISLIHPQVVFKIFLQDVFKMSWRKRNCYTENFLKTSSMQVRDVCWESSARCLLPSVLVQLSSITFIDVLIYCLFVFTVKFRAFLCDLLCNGFRVLRAGSKVFLRFWFPFPFPIIWVPDTYL